MRRTLALLSPWLRFGRWLYDCSGLFNGQVFSADGGTQSAEYTITESAYYIIRPAWIATVAGSVSIYIRINNERYRDNAFSEANYITLGKATLIKCTAGDVITITLEQSNATLAYVLFTKEGTNFED